MGYGSEISYWIKKNQEKELEAWSLKEIWQWVEILIRRLSEFLWDKSGFWSISESCFTQNYNTESEGLPLDSYHLIKRPVRRKLRWYEINLNPIDHPHFLICSLLWKSICLLFTPSVALTLMATSTCFSGICHPYEGFWLSFQGFWLQCGHQFIPLSFWNPVMGWECRRECFLPLSTMPL